VVQGWQVDGANLKDLSRTDAELEAAERFQRRATR